MNPKEKILNIEHEDGKRKIVVTHLTIRQSISFLLLKLFLIEILTSGAIIVFHFSIFSTSYLQELIGFSTIPNILLLVFFLLLVFLKLIFVGVVIIQWLNEYYEITPREVIHRSGLIYKKEDKNTLDHLGLLELEQGIMGRVFNFGSLKLFNWATEKDFVLYLIHNPKKYHHILQILLPEADEEKKVFREHMIEPEEI